jgi:hypothetical protein
VYLETKGSRDIDWIPVAHSGEKRRSAVNPMVNPGSACTCYIFKKALFRGVAKILNPLDRAVNGIWWSKDIAKNR